MREYSPGAHRPPGPPMTSKLCGGPFSLAASLCLGPVPYHEHCAGGLPGVPPLPGAGTVPVAAWCGAAPCSSPLIYAYWQKEVRQQFSRWPWLWRRDSTCLLKSLAQGWRSRGRRESVITSPPCPTQSLKAKTGKGRPVSKCLSLASQSPARSDGAIGEKEHLLLATDHPCTLAPSHPL